MSKQLHDDIARVHTWQSLEALNAQEYSRQMQQFRKTTVGFSPPLKPSNISPVPLVQAPTQPADNPETLSSSADRRSNAALDIRNSHCKVSYCASCAHEELALGASMSIAVGGWRLRVQGSAENRSRDRANTSAAAFDHRSCTT